MTWLHLLACAGTPVVPEPPPAPVEATPIASAPAAPAPPSTDLKPHMAEHLAQATATRNAVVHGRFDDAQAGFKALAAHPAAGGLPEASLAWVQSMNDAARAGEAATDTTEQAMALGALANACGGCHQTLQTGPVLQELPRPAEGEGVYFHMAQHVWANDRMWAALIEPSAAAWERSLRVLGTETVPAAEIADWGLEHGDEAMDETVHRLAEAALADDNPDTRADLYGQILSQCASCHRAARGEPAL